MGLFGKLMKNVEEAKSKAGHLKSQIDQVGDGIAEAAASITGKKDTRPFAPQEVLIHQQHECVKIYGAQYNQDALSKLPGNFVDVVIGKKKVKEWDAYPITTVDGTMLGTIYSDGLEKAGIKPGAMGLAEIHRPIYYLDDGITLFLQRTPEAIADEKRRDSLKFWTNLEMKKWEGGEGERHDFTDVDVLVKPGSDKPTYVVIGDGRRVFEVGPRMKMHAELAAREEYKPRRLIVEQRTGDHGAYYHVGFYY